MAEILRLGESEWSHVEDCAGCDSRIKYDVNDLKWEPPGGDMRESWPGEFVVRCPVCARGIVFKEADVPKLVARAVQGK